MLLAYCGKGGIRTPGASQHGGFQDRCNRPLYHLSSACNEVSFSKAMQRYDVFLERANVFTFFLLFLQKNIKIGHQTTFRFLRQGKTHIKKPHHTILYTKDNPPSKVAEKASTERHFVSNTNSTTSWHSVCNLL